MLPVLTSILLPLVTDYLKKAAVEKAQTAFVDWLKEQGVSTEHKLVVHFDAVALPAVTMLSHLTALHIDDYTLDANRSGPSILVVHEPDACKRELLTKTLVGYDKGVQEVLAI